MARWHIFKVGDKVRVARHWSHYIKFGAVCTVTFVSQDGNGMEVYGPVQYGDPSHIADGYQHMRVSIGHRLAKQAVNR